MSEQRPASMIAELMERGRLVWRLMNDERTPTWLKVGVPLVVFLYFISPVDLIPDFLLGLGQLDDLGIVLLGMALFIRLAPDSAVKEHRRALGMTQDEPVGGEPTRRVASNGKPIDGEFEVRGQGSGSERGPAGDETAPGHNHYRQ